MGPRSHPIIVIKQIFSIIVSLSVKSVIIFWLAIRVSRWRTRKHFLHNVVPCSQWSLEVESLKADKISSHLFLTHSISKL